MLCALLLTAVGLLQLFGAFIYSPNDYIYAFGGDAFVLYYDIVFHVLHGDSYQTLDAMLYPRGELIYLTDAQGMLSILLRFIHLNVVDLSDVIIGIVHSLNNWAVLAATPVVFQILRRLGAGSASALLLSPSVVLLSPQMFRVAGHFGLAYPFVIPLTILWFLRKRKRPDLKDAFVALVLLFFTLNNPYVGFSAGLTVLVAVFIGVITTRRTHMPGLITAGITLSVLASVFIYFSLLDPFEDRVQLQWGPLFFRTSWAGSLVPDGSLIRRWFAAKTQTEWEARSYIGVLPFLALLTWPIISGVRYYLKKAGSFSMPARWWPYALSAALIYLACYDYSFSDGTGRWLEEKAGFLLMFKAMPRIAWPFYFAVALVGCVLIDWYVRLLDSRFSFAATSLLLAIFGLSVYDVYVYHRKRVFEPFDNVFRTTRLESHRDVFAAMGIHPDKYQALLTVPRLLTWNDNVLTEWDWGAHYASVLVSVATGTPMLNATLSRAPVQPLMDVTQLMSQPMIDRLGFLTLLPDDRPLLLVHGNGGDVRTEGEAWLLALADSLGKTDQATFYQLSLPSVRQAQREALANLCSRAQETTLPPLLHLNFEGNPSKEAYAGEGALSLPFGRHVLFEFTNDRPASELAVSCWIRSTAERYGVGQLIVTVSGINGEVVSEYAVEVRQLTNAEGMWFFFEHQVAVANEQTLRLAFVAQYDGTFVDEVTITPAGVDVVAQSSGDVLLNGIRIHCE